MKYVIAILLCLLLSGCAYCHMGERIDPKTQKGELYAFVFAPTGAEVDMKKQKVKVNHPLGFVDRIINFVIGQQAK